VILTRIERILKWFEQQTHFRFYSSSLLIVYEGMESVPSSSLSPSNDTKSADPIADVWMIDFGHVMTSEDGSKDHNYIYGLNSLLKVLRTFRTSLSSSTSLSMTSIPIPISISTPTSTSTSSTSISPTSYQ